MKYLKIYIIWILTQFILLWNWFQIAHTEARQDKYFDLIIPEIRLEDKVTILDNSTWWSESNIINTIDEDEEIIYSIIILPWWLEVDASSYEQYEQTLLEISEEIDQLPLYYLITIYWDFKEMKETLDVDKNEARILKRFDRYLEDSIRLKSDL